MGDETDSGRMPTLGRIQLKQVKVSRGAQRGGAANQTRQAGDNPMNRLVPYLDLFSRLEDAELGRLAAVDESVVAELRKQVDDIGRALVSYLDLVERLTEEEFVRLTGASVKTIRFWKLCQPRRRGDSAASSSTSMGQAHVRSGSSPAAESSATMERAAAGEASSAPPGAEPRPPAGTPGPGIPSDDDDDDDFMLTFQE